MCDSKPVLGKEREKEREKRKERNRKLFFGVLKEKNAQKSDIRERNVRLSRNLNLNLNVRLSRLGKEEK